MKHINNNKFRHILVVDDQPENLQAIADMYKESDLPYKIIRAPNGKIALKLIKAQCPDLVITDWDMPGMDGIELIKELRKLECAVETPVIMCTGVMTTSENLSTALNAGATDYIRKPVDKIELLSRTSSALMLADSYINIKESNATKDKFFSIIAHDLKSPFSGIIGMTEMLKKNCRKYDIDEIEKFIDLMNEAAVNGFNLLENLLEWSRMQTGKIEFNPEKIDLHEQIEINMNLLKQKAQEKNISLVNKIEENTLVLADTYMINTILRNLISNAIKFTPNNGTITITGKQSNEYYEITVLDTGIGMQHEVIDNLFRIDLHHSTPGTNKEKGTGIGLNLCAELIEKAGGKIRAESEIEKGSAFHFTIPGNKVN